MYALYTFYSISNYNITPLIQHQKGYANRAEGLAPQVSSALERKANEPFATLQLVTNTPAVWILNFRVRYTLIERD